MIENNQRDFHALDDLGDFLHFATTREQRRIGTLPLGFDNRQSAHTGGFSQQAQLRQTLVVVGIAEIDTDQNCGLGRMPGQKLFVAGGRLLHYSAASWGMLTARTGTIVEIACL